MDMHKYLEDNSVIIVPNKLKETALGIISRENKLLDIKVTSFNELKKKLLFDIKKGAIGFLAQSLNIKHEVASLYLENIYYIEDEDYPDEKRKKLKEIKDLLDKNNYLIKDSLFINSLNGRKVIIYGFDYITKFEHSLLDKLKGSSEVIICEKTYDTKQDFHIYEFHFLEEEVNYVFYKISELLESGVPISNIKLANLNKDYDFYISKYSRLYNININRNASSSLYETALASAFINLLDTYSIPESLEELTKVFNLKEASNLELYNQLIDALNKIENKTKENIIYEFKKTKLKTNKYQNALEEVSLKDNIFDKEDHIFIMSFDSRAIPTIHKDDDYLSDELKKKMNLESSSELNKIENRTLLNIIKSMPNLTITYKLNSLFNTYYPSPLINKLGVQVETPSINKNTSYSVLSDKLTLAKYLDRYMKYGEYHKDISLLMNNHNIPYLTYDNTYKKINKTSLANYLNSTFNLSYSSIDAFYHCHFRYYLSSILKLKVEDSNEFSLLIGNLYHHVLESYYKEDFDFNESWNSYLQEYTITKKEEVLLSKLKEELLFIIETLKEQDTHSSLDNYLLEERVVINKEVENYNVTFKGFVDKIAYKEIENETVLSITDYKTGSADINLYNLPYGLSMQLPTYLYLVRYSNLFNNYVFGGFYLQKVLTSDFVNDGKDSYEEKRRNSLKLSGYSNSNLVILKHIDDTYEDSKLIKSLKTKKDGDFYSTSKVLNSYEIDKIIEITEKNIEDAAKKIIDADFNINPIRLGNKLEGCKFCDYKEICYMSEKNIVTKEEITNLDFLKEEVTL